MMLSYTQNKLAVDDLSDLLQFYELVTDFVLRIEKWLFVHVLIKLKTVECMLRLIAI